MGRSLQFAALVILPLAMALQIGGFLQREFPVSKMVLMLVFGMALFGVGRIIEAYSAPANSAMDEEHEVRR